MSKKMTDVVAYLGWVGLLIAYIMGDREASNFHLNQSLVILLMGTISSIIWQAVRWIPLLGVLVSSAMGIVSLFCIVCQFIGFISAIQGNERPVPFLGQFQLLR